MLNNFLRMLVHILLPTRRPLIKFIRTIRNDFKDSNIIEIGSGNIDINQSMEKYFDKSNNFIQTDINKDYNHLYLDITEEITTNQKFDLVLCTNVLEHIFETKKAIKNLKTLLSDQGSLLVSVPFIYPLHDEPKDYWRFTEHSLRKLFEDFVIEKFEYTGLRQFPIQYIFLLKINHDKNKNI